MKMFALITIINFLKFYIYIFIFCILTCCILWCISSWLLNMVSESILAEYQEKERKRTAVTITPCDQPSPRSNFSLVSLSNSEMLLFGGEYCDGETTIVFNDLFRWNMEKNEWKQIESLNTPSPRCSHQAVVFKDNMYIFGGEYATLDQFHHYRDMWVLNLKTNVWREISCVGGDAPSAR